MSANKKIKQTVIIKIEIKKTNETINLTKILYIQQPYLIYRRLISNLFVT